MMATNCTKPVLDMESIDPLRPTVNFKPAATSAGQRYP